MGNETRGQFWIIGGVLALLFLLGQYPDLVTWLPLGAAFQRLAALLHADIHADPTQFLVAHAAIFLCALGALEAIRRALPPADIEHRPTQFWREAAAAAVLGFGVGGILQMAFQGLAVLSAAGGWNVLTILAMSLLGILGACLYLFGRPWPAAAPWVGFALILRGAYVILLSPFINRLFDAGGMVAWYYLQSLIYAGFVLTLGIQLAFVPPKARGDLSKQTDPGRLAYLVMAGLAFAFCVRQIVFLTPAYGQPTLMSLPAIPLLAVAALWSLHHAVRALALLDCLRPPVSAAGGAHTPGAAAPEAAAPEGITPEAARKRRMKIILIALAVALGIPLLLFGILLVMLANMGPIR